MTILGLLAAQPEHFEQFEDARQLGHFRETALLEDVVQRENADQVDDEPALYVVEEDFAVGLDYAAVAVVGREARDHHVSRYPAPYRRKT